MRRFRAALGGIALATAMTVGTPAYATDFLFSLKNVSTNNAPYMDFSKTASDGTTLSVRASAWSIGSHSVYGTATYVAKLGGYAEGLGITSFYENGSYPGHTMDNEGEPEFLLLQFSAPVLLNTFTTTPFAFNNVADSDATVAWGNTTQAWNKTLDLDWKPTSALAAILTQTSISGGSTTSTRATGGNAASNLWLVAASLTNPDGKIDGFKLGGISATTNPVPEPATWMMMILGFGVVGHALRRRKTARTAVTA